MHLNEVKLLIKIILMPTLETFCLWSLSFEHIALLLQETSVYSNIWASYY